MILTGFVSYPSRPRTVNCRANIARLRSPAKAQRREDKIAVAETERLHREVFYGLALARKESKSGAKDFSLRSK
jgi:hypothetical protein